MKPIKIVLISLICAFFYGCNIPIEKKIEKGFTNYVYKNFADPDDLQEIISISISDTLDVNYQVDYLNNKLIEVLNDFIKDSIEIKDSHENEILSDKKILSYKFQKRLEESFYFEEYNEDLNNFYNFRINNIDSINFLTNTIKNYKNNVDSTKPYLLYSYNIKARVIDKDIKKIVSYKAFVNPINQEIIFENEKFKNTPFINELTNGFDIIFGLSMKKIDLRYEIIESKTDLLLYINRLKYIDSYY